MTVVDLDASEAYEVLPAHLDLEMMPVDSTEVLRFTASIIKIFSPITKALVAHLKIHDASHTLPDTAVIKIYDPRFTNDRLPEVKGWPTRPWSLDLETASVRRREACARGELEDEFDKIHFNLSTEGHPIFWEERFYRHMNQRFKNELEAYSRLKHRQGEGILQCFGSGVFDVDSTRLVKPPFIILEYLASTPLPLMDPTTITEPLMKSLLDTVTEFGPRGIIHSDPRPDNILFGPPAPSAPTRVVIIDFGEAGFRMDGETEEEWNETVRTNSEVIATGSWLHQAGVPGAPDHRICPLPLPEDWDDSQLQSDYEELTGVNAGFLKAISLLGPEEDLCILPH